LKMLRCWSAVISRRMSLRSARFEVVAVACPPWWSSPGGAGGSRIGQCRSRPAAPLGGASGRSGRADETTQPEPKGGRRDDRRCIRKRRSLLLEFQSGDWGMTIESVIFFLFFSLAILSETTSKSVLAVLWDARDDLSPWHDALAPKGSLPGRLNDGDGAGRTDGIVGAASNGLSTRPDRCRCPEWGRVRCLPSS